MKKFVIALSLICLPACSTRSTLASPAPLAQTQIDEKALIVGLETFDTLLTAVDRLRVAGVIKPGSPTAIKLADAIQITKQSYQAADAALKVGNAHSYLIALTQARDAIIQIKSLIKG